MSSPDVNDIFLQVQESLKDGPYACSSYTRLSGGTANFVIRGTLVTPLSDGSKTIVIKHTEGFVVLNPNFKLTSTRCEYEQTILSALSTLAPSTTEGITVQTAKLHHFDTETNTQICADLPSSTDLKAYCLAHALTQPQSLRIGHALGRWAKSFHVWGQADAQRELVEKLKGNEAMRKLKFSINFDRLPTKCDEFPDILGGDREAFEAVRESVRRELDQEENALIHGDFWSGNVVIPQGPLEDQFSIFICDWELVQISCLYFDLGQMFAELFELKHYKDLDAGVWLIEGFMEGYGKIDEEMAVKVAMYVGVHLVNFGSGVKGWGTDEQVRECVRIGRRFVLDGSERRKEAFRGTALECLFQW